jgi:hypothetical protein
VIKRNSTIGNGIQSQTSQNNEVRQTQRNLGRKTPGKKGAVKKGAVKKGAVKKGADHNKAPSQGRPNECGFCYVFLVSDDAACIAGRVLHPKGGEIVNGLASVSRLKGG